MHAKTAVAVAGTLLAVPSVAVATDAPDPAATAPAAVRAPLGEHPTVGAEMLAAHRRDTTARLRAAHVRLARGAARLSGATLPHDYATRLRGETAADLRRSNRRLRARIRRLSGTRTRREAGSTAPPVLQAIAACESGGNPSTNTGNGFYGKYQFTQATWAAVGGSGNPAAASEAEQDRRAAQLYAQAGPGQWPVCGR